VVNVSHVREHALWELADSRGLSSVVVNVPLTHPPREFDGALVPGYTAPENPDCHPEGLLDEIRDAIGGYSVYAPGELEDRTREETIDGYREVARMRGEAFRHLADEFDPEFGFVQFQHTDTVFHQLPGDDEAIRAAYGAVDEQVGAIIDECDPDILLVASDHGIGEYTGYELRVNEFLKNRGYVEPTRDAETVPSWSSVVRGQLMQGETDAEESPSALERAMGLASKVGVTSQRLGRVLEALRLAELALEYVPDDAVRAGAEHVSFRESAAFMRSRIECGVRINLEGREPDGVVAPDEYEELRDALIDEFRSLRTPDGDPVFDAVTPREELFHGPYVEEAADVMLVPADYDQYLSALLLGDEFGEPSQPYNHKRHGIIAASGAGIDASSGDGGIESSGTLADAHLFDVAPTVLASLGIPVSDRMDGRVLPFVESTERTAYPEFDADDIVETDDQRIEERLGDLGYLE
jgi:predicted AlkP superfamily phosphohydrolase/phosphomutase